MSSAAGETAFAQSGQDGSGRRARPIWPYAVAIGLSAWLLFSIELFAGKVVLPAFGGAPSVWTTSLCFFTAVLFVGYLYAHLVTSRLSPRAGASVHLAVALLAVAAALAAPRDIASLRMSGIPQALNVLVVLVVIAGPVAFLLSATSPLLSAWYANRGDQPWWLYALSNAASFGALVAYPFLIEPTVPLSMQRTTIPFLLLPFLGALAFAAPWKTASAAASPKSDRAPAVGLIPFRRQALWLLAAGVPAGLLSATTTYLSADHVSVPLLWIGPLAVYLASLAVAFSGLRDRALRVADGLLPAAITLMWVPMLLPGTWPVRVVLPVLLGSYAVVATSIHGRLALARPAESNLTHYYLIVSAGGMLATGFVALLAPVVFDGVYEYPMLIALSLAALWLLPMETDCPPVGFGATSRYIVARLLPYMGVAAVLQLTAQRPDASSRTAVLLALGLGAMVIAANRSLRVFCAGTLVVLALLVPLIQTPRLVRIRTFFGVTEVRNIPGTGLRSEIHGTTVHGVQLLDTRAVPTAYYVKAGPLGDVMRTTQMRLSDGADIGVVGLGIGTIAAYARQADDLTFYEIDPAVVRLAQDRRYFTFLTDAASSPRVVMGDGRLSIADGPSTQFDVLVLDAFSSDSIPLHLLTREALSAYRRAMRPGGLIAFHLSSRAFNLVPAVAATARAEGLDAVTRTYVPSMGERKTFAAQPSIWLVAADSDALNVLRASGWTSAPSGTVLTDDFSDVVRLLRLR